MTNSAHANTDTLTEQRIDALAKIMACDPSDITPSRFDDRTFEGGSGEYLVLTDEEADELVRERIVNDLWSFRASFIASHTRNGLSLKCIDALDKMLGTLCEDASPIVEALIEDLDRFVADAIRADGRGHFLAQYDFEEIEEGGFYIYRTN